MVIGGIRPSTWSSAVWPVPEARDHGQTRYAELSGRGSRRLLGSADKPSRPSTVEDRPADLVSQPLILQHEFANHIRELFALPTAPEPAGALTLPSGGRRTRGLDSVGRSTKLVCGDMRHHCR